jgi:hypothetical protein
MSNFAIALDKLGFANDQYNTSSEKVGALLMHIRYGRLF